MSTFFSTFCYHLSYWRQRAVFFDNWLAHSHGYNFVCFFVFVHATLSTITFSQNIALLVWRLVWSISSGFLFCFTFWTILTGMDAWNFELKAPGVEGKKLISSDSWVQAEARAEFAERSVQKLQKEVDRLEGKTWVFFFFFFSWQLHRLLLDDLTLSHFRTVLN